MKEGYETVGPGPAMGNAKHGSAKGRTSKPLPITSGQMDPESKGWPEGTSRTVAPPGGRRSKQGDDSTTRGGAGRPEVGGITGYKGGS